MDTQAAIASLREIAETADERGIAWWLHGGTCLGVVREGRLLPHDEDIDIGIAPSSDILALRQRLHERGFDIPYYVLHRWRRTAFRRKQPKRSRVDTRTEHQLPAGGHITSQRQQWQRRAGLVRGSSDDQLDEVASDVSKPAMTEHVTSHGDVSTDRIRLNAVTPASLHLRRESPHMESASRGRHLDVAGRLSENLHRQSVRLPIDKTAVKVETGDTVTKHEPETVTDDRRLCRGV